VTFRRYGLTMFWLLALELVAVVVLNAAHIHSAAVAFGVGGTIGFTVIWVGLAPTRRF
jgi:hypothetical protein